MFKKIAFVVSIIVMAFSCQNDHLAEKSQYSNLIIKTGTICGWCSVDDTLTIHGNSVRYVNYTQCSNNQPAVEKNGQVLTSQLDTLLANLNLNEFKKLNLNSCNVCADGCDNWIFFDNGIESHYIRFGTGDPKLQPIQLFIDQLNAIKTQYSKVD